MRRRHRRVEAMELLIIRHAIAFARDRRRWADDTVRPLSPAGIRRSRKAAAGLEKLCRAPDRLLTSPLLRAAQTAKILTQVAGWPRAEMAPELAPGQAAAAVLTLLSKDRSRRIAIVGHQPDLSALLAACLLRSHDSLPIEMKKNAVACLSFAGRVRVGGAVLAWLATPRMLRSVRNQ
jgi:phosphohistidine phosphatase